MKTLISLVWFVCGIILGIKWFKNSECNVIRAGNAMHRTEGKFWDCCFYIFLALLSLGVPFGLLLMLIKGIGMAAKIIVFAGAIGIIIYSVYCVAKRKENVLFTFLKSSTFKTETDNAKKHSNEGDKE